MMDQQRALPRTADSAPKTMVVILSVCFDFLRSSISELLESALRSVLPKSSSGARPSRPVSEAGEPLLEEDALLAPPAGKRILLSSSTKQYVESSSGVCGGVKTLYGWRQAKVPTFPEAK